MLHHIKSELFEHCCQHIDARLQLIQNKIADIQKSIETETKSTAGDKHETGRAMLQIEREKMGQQFYETTKLKSVLNRINLETPFQKVGLGSIVYTTQTNYFIAISVGEIKVEGISYYAISSNTPIAKSLLSKSIGDTITFRNQVIRITKIL